MALPPSPFDHHRHHEQPYQPNINPTEKPKLDRNLLKTQITIALGGTMVDVELEDPELNYCIDVTIDRYRQRSGGAIEQSYVFLDVQPEVATYQLPNEVQEVQSVYRNIIGNSGGAAIDPFSLAFTNNIYMIQNPAQLGTTGAGLLATYDFAMQYQNLIGRMFGREVTFNFDTYTKKLTLDRRFTATETVALMVWNERPELALLNDPYTKPWIRSMAIAQGKMLLGQARSKFGGLAGPQGGITLNGEALKQEAQAEMDKLELELINLIDSRQGYGFIIG